MCFDFTITRFVHLSKKKQLLLLFYLATQKLKNTKVKAKQSTNQEKKPTNKRRVCPSIHPPIHPHIHPPIHPSTHPSIHPSSSAYPGLGHRGSCLSRDAQTFLSLDTSSSSSRRIPRCSQAS